MDGINYYGVDTLTINTGSGAETVSVQGTTANTTLNLAVGNHQVFIASDADLDAILRAQDLDLDNAPDLRQIAARSQVSDFVDQLPRFVENGFRLLGLSGVHRQACLLD